MKKLLSIVGLVILLASSSGVVPAQDRNKPEQRVVNAIPGKVPISVEILNAGMDTPLENLEIRIRNSGDRPIYNFELALSSATYFMSGHCVGLTRLEFGNPKLGNFTPQPAEFLAAQRAATVPLGPGEIKIFTLQQKEIDSFWIVMKDKGYDLATAKILLELSILSFGDGTGYMTPSAVELPGKEGPKPSGH